MKRLISIILTIIAFALLLQDCKKEEQTGSIYGTVTDYATGEPVKDANVKLRPSGTSTKTGSDGTYSFPDLKPGQYSLSLSKAEYEDLEDDYVITLAEGKDVCRDVQMVKKASTLVILDDHGNTTDLIDFGDEVDDVSRLFNIFNNSGETLSWQITVTANWVSVNMESGTLTAGNTQGIIVMVNRSNLPQGESTTTLHITSNHGNKQLTIKAIGGFVSTLPATAITETSAVLHGKILQSVPYTEKGFVYGTNHNLNHNIVNEGNAIGEFSQQISIDATSIWYYKAYCVLNGNTYYGEEKSFGPYYNDVPSFQYGGNLYMVAPDPGNNMYLSSAYSYCEGLTLYGFSDWRIPTQAELMAMYTQRASIGGFSNVNYWSSTQSTGGKCFYIDFSSGETDYTWGGGEMHVRPVRVCN